MPGEIKISPAQRGVDQFHRLWADVAALAVDQHGVVARRQLIELGFSTSAIDRATGSGRLHRLYRAVYAVGHRNVSRRGWMMAAVLACGVGAVLSHRCAGGEWNLRGWSGAAEITVPSWRTGPDTVIVRSSPSMLDDERTVREGIPITTVARTIFDLASVLDEAALARVVEEAEHQRLTSPLSLPATLERHHGERGAARLRGVLEAAGYGMGVTNRKLEELFIDFVAEYRLPHPELNPTLFLDGSLLRPDCLWRSNRVIVELQSVRHHGSAGAMTRDAIRVRRLILAGYSVIEVTWAQLHDPAERRELARDLARLLS